MILYLSGLNNMASDQIDAARLGGATGWKMLWNGVLPQLRSATFIALVVTVIGALRVRVSQRVGALHVWGRNQRIWRTLWFCGRDGPVSDHAGLCQRRPVADATGPKGKPLTVLRPIEKASVSARISCQGELAHRAVHPAFAASGALSDLNPGGVK